MLLTMVGEHRPRFLATKLLIVYYLLPIYAYNYIDLSTKIGAINYQKPYNLASQNSCSFQILPYMEKQSGERDC